MAIRWERFDEETLPLPEHVIAGAELVFGVRFPADYRECLRVNHGAQPKQDEFEAGAPGDRWEGNVGQLLTLDPRRPGNMFAVLADLAVDDQLPELVLPVAEDGGGNFLCLDYRADPSRSEPAVAFWFHEVSGPDGIVPVAQTWTKLETILHEPAA